MLHSKHTEDMAEKLISCARTSGGAQLLLNFCSVTPGTVTIGDEDEGQ